MRRLLTLFLAVLAFIPSLAMAGKAGENAGGGSKSYSSRGFGGNVYKPATQRASLRETLPSGAPALAQGKVIRS